MMNVPSPNSRVTNLNYVLQKSLLAHLDENFAWRLVAEASRIFSEQDILHLSRSASPSWKLLVELDDKLCTVEQLCYLLENCQLLNALSVLKGHEPLVIVTQPGPPQDEEPTCYVPLGGQLRLECKATGLPPPNYKWHFENTEIPGQDSELLLIDNFQTDNKGEYCCQVSQLDSTLNSNWVNVQLLPHPPVFHQQPPAITVCKEGNDVVITCEATGYPQPEFQWWFNQNCLVDNQKTNSLKLDDIKVDQSGFYQCYAKNQAGAVYSNQAEVQVYEPSSESVDNYTSERHQAVEKVALLIANDTYKKADSLNNPQNDVITLAKLLTSLGYKVIALRNLNLVEMKNALETFCQLLHGGDYALFYFAGHGFEYHGKYMLPVDAPSSDKYLRSDSLCETEVIRDVLQTKPLVLVILLDMCLKAPTSDNTDILNECPESYSYDPSRNLIVGYATTSNLGAFERANETNGIYMKHLHKLINSNLPIDKILGEVGKSVSKDATDVSEKQMPFWSLNVVENFYFTDAAIGHEKTKKDFEMLNCLPPVARIEFHKVRTVAMAKFSRLAFFQNGLEIRITNLESWKVCVDECGMELNISRDLVENVGYLIITIHNLQKIKAELSLTISLKDKNSDKLVDIAILDIGMPLIGPASLWFNKSKAKPLDSV